MTTKRLLFVCSGNTCRSPLAEVMAREAAARTGYGDEVAVRSAGAFAGEGIRASEGARQVARDMGLDLEEHRSALLTEEAVDWADLVLCMSQSHLRTARELSGEGGGEKARLVTDFLPEDHPSRGREVRDPHGSSLERYRETAELLQEAVHSLLGALLGESGGQEAEEQG